jgi:hypothetical protein
MELNINSKVPTRQRSREQQWVAAHAETHYTLYRISSLWDIEKRTAAKRLGVPDKVYPRGQGSRLYLKTTVINLLGEPKKSATLS